MPSKGRRHPAPPRRIPAAANDNARPVRERLKQLAFMAMIAGMAVSLVLNAV